MKIVLIFLLLHPILGEKLYSYHAALFIDGTKFCSGALIHERYVITSARCVYKAFEVLVLVGVKNLLDLNVGYRGVSTTFIIPDNFDPNQIQTDNEFGLVQLTSELSGDRFTILDIPSGWCFCCKPSHPCVLCYYLLTGFKNNDKFGNYSCKNEIVYEWECNSPYQYIYINSSIHDEGSPLSCSSNYLTGILVKQLGNKTTFASVWYNRKWIKKNIKRNLN